MNQIEIVKACRDYLVIRKPVMMDSEHDVTEALRELGLGTVYPVHRLDRNVGGVMVYARTGEYAAYLSGEIQENRFTKEYICIAAGRIPETSGEMRDFLLKDNQKKKSFPVSSMRKGVKEAVLRYRVLSECELEGQAVSLVRVRLVTGRYHQIRVQFAARRHPLLGDRKYGSRVNLEAPALFCRRIAFTEKNGTPVSYELEPPLDFPWSMFPDEVFGTEE